MILLVRTDPWNAAWPLERAIRPVESWTFVPKRCSVERDCAIWSTYWNELSCFRRLVPAAALDTVEWANARHRERRRSRQRAMMLHLIQRISRALLLSLSSSLHRASKLNHRWTSCSIERHAGIDPSIRRTPPPLQDREIERH
jgi:hypothetical protein